MAYLFGLSNADAIDCGTGVTKASTWTFFWRGKLTNSSDTGRVLVAFRGNQQFVGQLYAGSVGVGANNQLTLSFSKGSGGSFPFARYGTGIAAATITAIIGTYDGVNLSIYLNASATPVAQQAENGTPDQVAGQHFFISNDENANGSSDSTTYEVGYWPFALISSQAAALGAGPPFAVNVPACPFYWPLINGSIALFGGQHGTLIGAPSLAAHVFPNLYAPLEASAWRGAWRGMTRGA
jgi:hypothetical protein